jgi:hypothetical protein
MANMGLSIEAIAAFTNDISLERGRKYHKAGRVTEFEETGDVAKAVIIGTDAYAVELSLGTLEGKCSCIAFAHYDGWCKHIVALAMAVVEGVVESKKPPAIKGKSSQPHSTNDRYQELLTHLNNKSKAELIAALKQIAEHNSWVEDALLKLWNTESTSDFRSLKKQIQPLFTRLNMSNWDRYVRQIETIDRAISELYMQVPANAIGVKSMLELAYWISEKKLTCVDDSYGILQGTISGIINWAVGAIEYDQSVIDVLLEAATWPSEMGFGEKILESALYEGLPEVQAIVADRLERTMYRRDAQLQLDQDTALPMLLRYLLERDRPRFAQVLSEYGLEKALSQNQYKSLYVDYLRRENDHQTIIDLLWPDRTGHFYLAQLTAAVEAAGDHKKRRVLYEDSLKTHFDTRTLADYKQFMLAHFKTEWPAASDKLLKQNLPAEHRVDLLMQLGEYGQIDATVQQALAKLADWEKESFARYLETVAKRLQYIDKPASVCVMVRLLEHETSKLDKSNHYKRIYEYIDQLLALGQTATIHDYAEKTMNRYPNKTKLVEFLAGLA